jgi:hypothetical protein
VIGGLAAALLVVAAVVAVVAVLPAARRTRLGPWHPAVAWLALTGVFFAAGSAVLAIVDGRAGPALFVAACGAAFAAGVAASDRVARLRGAPALPGPPTRPAVDAAPVRPLRAFWLGILALLAVVPILAQVGIPFLSTNVTDARVELGGLALQGLRVAFPAFAAATILVASRRRRPSERFVTVLAVCAILIFELALASRYLAAELVATVLLVVALSGRRLPVRALAAVAVLSIAVFVGVQVVRAWDQAAGRELAFAVERTVNRVVLIQPRTLGALQQVIPAEEPHFAGLTWLRRIGPALGRDVPNLGYWIYPRLFPGQDTPGYAAPGLIGEAWANFGALGVFLLAAFGAVAERLGVLIALRRTGTADLVAGGLVVLLVARTHALGAVGLLVLLVLVLGWRLIVARESGLVADARRVLAWRV